MPQSPEKQDESACARPRFRFRRLAWLLAALLLVGGVLCWRHLQRFRVVLSFADTNLILEPRTAGFLVGGEETPYSFYDWRGTLIWRVGETHRGRYIRAGEVLMETEKRCALSPDGQYLSVIDSVPWAKLVELKTWLKGKPYRTMTVPLGIIDAMQQMNDGSVFIAGKRQGEASRLLWIKDARIAAKAQGDPVLDIAPDGSAAMVSNRAGRTQYRLPHLMTSANGEIRLQPTLHRAESTVHEQGIVLYDDGFRLVNGAIKRLVPGAPNVRLAGLSRGRAYALFAGQGRAVVISPVNGAHWTFPIEDGAAIQKGLPGIAENGHFVAVIVERDAYRKLRRLYAAFPPLAQRLPRRNRRDVLLYARPGRLVANLSTVLNREIVTDAPWHPSPDGRALFGFIRENGARHCVLIRR